MTDKQKYYKIPVNEKHIKPAILYQRNHLFSRQAIKTCYNSSIYYDCFNVEAPASFCKRWNFVRPDVKINKSSLWEQRICLSYDEWHLIFCTTWHIYQKNN